MEAPEGESAEVLVEVQQSPGGDDANSGDSMNVPARSGTRKRHLDAVASASYLTAALVVLLVVGRLSFMKAGSQAKKQLADAEAPSVSSTDPTSAESSSSTAQVPVYSFPDIDEPEANEKLRTLLKLLQSPLPPFQDAASLKGALHLEFPGAKLTVKYTRTVKGRTLPSENAYREAAHLLETMVKSMKSCITDGNLTTTAFEASGVEGETESGSYTMTFAVTAKRSGS